MISRIFWLNSRFLCNISFLCLKYLWTYLVFFIFIKWGILKYILSMMITVKKVINISNIDQMHKSLTAHIMLDTKIFFYKNKSFFNILLNSFLNFFSAVSRYQMPQPPPYTPPQGPYYQPPPPAYSAPRYDWVPYQTFPNAPPGKS